MSRLALLVVAFVLVGCKDKAESPAAGSASSAGSAGSAASSAAGGSPTPSTGGMQGGITESADALHVKYVGAGADLATIPSASAALGGLPLLGAVDVMIDVRVPKAKGVADYSLATGVIDLKTGRIQIGDDKTKLAARPAGPQGSGDRDARRTAFVGEGFEFGHLTVDAFHARIELANGRANLVTWKAESPDVIVELRASAELESKLEHSALDGCLRFMSKPALRQRDPKMDALVQTTGAMKEADGMFHITLAGTLDRPKRLPRACTP